MQSFGVTLDMALQVYLIRNLLNGKLYVGQTARDYQERFKEHVKASRTTAAEKMVVTKAIRKYGKDNFTCELLDASAQTQEELDALEIKYIKQFDCLVPNGYNVTTGGGGLHFPPEEASKRSHNIRRKGKNKYVGVIERDGAFRAKLNYLGAQFYIGTYVYEEDAAKARDMKALECHGNNALLNFPELREQYRSEQINLLETKNTPSKTTMRINLLETKNAGPKTVVNLRLPPSIAEAKSFYIGTRICGSRWQTKNNRMFYPTEQDAALAYDLEEFAKYGDSAELNYPHRIAEYREGKIIVNSFRAKTRSRYRGVTFHNRKWLAQICIKRKAKCIGYFLTEEEAAKAYDKRCWELFQDKNRLNFPELIGDQTVRAPESAQSQDNICVVLALEILSDPEPK